MPLLNVLSTTYRPLGTAKPRGNTPKADIQQVILQVKNKQGSLRQQWRQGCTLARSIRAAGVLDTRA
jgi:hypothetical protein